MARVQTSPNVRLTADEKRPYVAQGLRMRELAQKYALYGNHSGDYRAAYAELENGTPGIGINVELNGGETTPCAERIAIGSALTAGMNRLNPEWLQRASSDQRRQLQAGFKLKRLVMASSNPGKFPEVCADCEAWLWDNQHMSPQTQIASLGETPQKRPFLLMQDLATRYPYWSEPRVGSTWSGGLADNQPLPKPLYTPEAAAIVMRQKPALATYIEPLIREAYRQYCREGMAVYSHQYHGGVSRRTGVAMLFSERPVQDNFQNGQRPLNASYDGARYFVVAGPRLEIKRRWFIPADLGTAYSGFAQQLAHQNPKLTRIEAIAYYSDDPNVLAPDRLGKLAQVTRGGPDTLVITFRERDPSQKRDLFVSTIQDHLPYTAHSNGHCGTSEKPYG